MWQVAATRWRNCSISGRCRISRNSGWPTRKVCSSAWLPYWKFDSMRSSSTARGVRFCASSTISRQRLPWLVWLSRKASSVTSSSDLATSLTLKPKAAPTMRSVSSASSCVVTRWPMTTSLPCSPSISARSVIVLPAPISPVMTTKPSCRDTPYSR